MRELINYKISLDKLTKHYLTVECNIERPNADGQVVSLPAWVPGSYMIRDFGKLVVTIQAKCRDIPIAMQKIQKNTWKCAPCNGPLQINYDLFCFDLAPRGAYVDHMRAFFDGCRVFLVVEGQEEQNSRVEILHSDLTAAGNWRCATSMQRVDVAADGFGKYFANNHLELIDHPFEISPFKSFEFEVADVPHVLVVSGEAPADLQRVADDLQKICKAQVDFFGELPPMDRYVFLLNVLAKGWGGIEHRSSTSLACTRTSLPKYSETDKSEDYKALLGVMSHEYFHLWNVKRIKPEVFINPNLQAEVYTRQLWMFEGFTAYYDNLNCVRAGVFSDSEYLNILQNDVNSYLLTPGAGVQTLEDSSFDAWIKYYQPDENSVNATVSYYTKGCLVALALDLLIIKRTKRKQSLADIMQVLWQQYGKTGLGLPENYFERVTFEVTGEDFSQFFEEVLRTTMPLQLAGLLDEVGVSYTPKIVAMVDTLGIKASVDQNRLMVKAVLSDSIAERAGLTPNDVIIAVNNFAVQGNNLEALLASFQVNDTLKFHVFRNDVLMELIMLYPELASAACELDFIAEPSERQMLNRQKWLQVAV